MKWVLIFKAHVNMDNVKFFCWEDGELRLYIERNEDLLVEDPDKKWYHKLCQLMGIIPYEECDKNV